MQLKHHSPCINVSRIHLLLHCAGSMVYSNLIAAISKRLPIKNKNLIKQMVKIALELIAKQQKQLVETIRLMIKKIAKKRIEWCALCLCKHAINTQMHSTSMFIK